MSLDDPAPRAVRIRSATSEDRGAIVDLCRVSLGWQPEDPNEAFLAWKHDRNSFGASPTWVAVDDSGRVLGVRFFMRWRFRAADGSLFQAVRAVDTATHPDARGQGIFSTLTLGALPDLTAMGVDFVFNTPNEKSRPGYLKMGWSLVGRVPLAVRPTGAGFFKKSDEVWSGSAKWGVESEVGWSPADAFADTDAVARLLASVPPSGGIETDRSADFLRWRYGFEPLNYRVFPVGESIEEGALVFRLRRRGARLDATICEELLPRRRLADPIYRRLGNATGADSLVRSQSGWIGPGPSLRVSRLGPLLTWKPLARAEVPTLDDLDLTAGDLELF